MANPEHLEVVRSGKDAIAAWRVAHPDERLDLAGANLHGARLNEAQLTGANLSKAHLSEAHLTGADLSEADLGEANLLYADLGEADLGEADLGEANLSRANLSGTNLTGASLSGTTVYGANLSAANLSRADLSRASLIRANLRRANLKGANCRWTDLAEADLTGADLTEADLTMAALVATDFTAATLTDCRVYGSSAWNLTLTDARQQNLIISEHGEPVVTVDDLEVAQFIYLMLNNSKIRNVIDTITSKAVLILGRFADPQRKAVLDSLRSKLREFDLLPIVFDFERPTDRDYTETVQTLASISMFVIADLTSPRSTPMELEATVKQFKIPYVPIIDLSVDPRPFAMLVDSQKSFHWVLPTRGYESAEALLNDENLSTYIIDPANAKREELRRDKSAEPEMLVIRKKSAELSPSL